jgi:hypothetical protein
MGLAFDIEVENEEGVDVGGVDGKLSGFVGNGSGM